MRISRCAGIVVSCVVFGVSSAMGASIVDDWDADEQWNMSSDSPPYGASYGSHTEPDTVGGNANALKITIGSAPGSVVGDHVFDTDTLLGDWTTKVGGNPVRSITFDFYAGAGGAVDYPAGLKLYFKSSSGNVWYYNLVAFPSDIPSGWSTFGANIWPYSPAAPYGNSWYTSGDDSLWASDFATVTEVGIWLAYQPDLANQIYGLDNFTLWDTQLPIPEPETYLVLGAVLLSLGVTFRRNLHASLVAARCRIRG